MSCLENYSYTKKVKGKINPNYLPTHYKVLDDDFFFQLNSVLFV